SFVAVMVVPIILEMANHSLATLRNSFERDRELYGFQEALQKVESHLVYESQFARRVRQPYQRFLIQSFGEGSRSVLVGQDRFLFHRNDVAHLAGPGILSAEFSTPPERGIDLFAGWREGNSDPKPLPLPFADSATILADFHTELKRRGVHLLVVIV